MKASRRNFIKTTILASSGMPMALNAVANSFNDEKVKQQHYITRDRDKRNFKISIFSKHLQWLDYKELGKVAGEIGFDGVDLTVRPQGHVLPENVTEDLPRAVSAIREAGLSVDMITTSITNAEDPATEKILKAASALGIQHYRLGYFHYDKKMGVEENLSSIRDKLKKLALLNERFSISGDYQNHSGQYFGASIWDLYLVLKQINSPWLGAQYDINHATIEGANTWPVELELLKSFIRSIDIKDSQWTNRGNKWQIEYMPLGTGMVDFNAYFRLLKENDIRVPVSVHYEYALGGAEHGARQLTISRDVVIGKMKNDLDVLRKFLLDVNLIEPGK